MRNIAKPVVTGNAHGQLTRRDLLFSLLALPLSSKLAAQGSKSAIRTNSLNNVMISVADMGRSVPFYEKLFGPSIKQGDLALFRLARSPRFFAIGPVKAGQKPGFTSYGIAIDDFDAERTAKLLSAAGASAQVTTRAGTPELWITDPNDYKIQLVAPEYGHGSGAKGQVIPAAVKSTGRIPLPLQSISHVTLTVRDGARSKTFFQDVLGLRVQAMQDQTACLAVGPGPDFIAFGVNSKNASTVRPQPRHGNSRGQRPRADRVRQQRRGQAAHMSHQAPSAIE